MRRSRTLGHEPRRVPRRPKRPAWRPLAAFLVASLRRDPRRAARALAAARRSRVPRIAAAEAALLLVPHAGVPAALEAMRTLATEWPGRPRPTPEATPGGWRRRGRRLFARVYGPVAQRLDAVLGELHPDLRTWIIDIAYGRMLSRTGLDTRTRELLGVAVLATLGWERQLESHVRGAARMGADRRSIRAAVALGTAQRRP